MSQNERPYHCLLDTIHVKDALPYVVVYQILLLLFISYIIFPFALVFTIPALVTCICAAVGLAKCQPRLLVPFRIYVYISIFALLVLGASMFFVSIFYKETHEGFASLFHVSPDAFSILLHFFDNMATLFHLWQLPLVSKCRQYLEDTSKNGEANLIRSHEAATTHAVLL